MGCVAEEAGLMAVTEKALTERASHKIVGDIYAHYQLLNSNEMGRDVYWIECYDRDGKFESGHLVELMFDDGLLWAQCGCEWFTEHWNHRTTCKHILAAAQMMKVRG